MNKRLAVVVTITIIALLTGAIVLSFTGDRWSAMGATIAILGGTWGIVRFGEPPSTP